MKFLYIAFTILLSVIGNASMFAQDVIYKHDGQTISAKSIVVGEMDIEYVRYDDVAAVVRMIPRTEVLKIVFADGKVKQISQTRKPGSVEVDKTTLWGTQAGERKGGGPGGKKPRKEAVEKAIFTIGAKYGWFTPSLMSYSANKSSGVGGGWGISVPLGKTVDDQVRKGAVAISFHMSLISSSTSYYVYDGNFGYNMGFNTLFLPITIAADYRIRLGRKAFIAPSLGPTLCITSSNAEVEEASPASIGINAGLDLVFRPLGAEFRFDTATNGYWFGLNLAL